MAHRLTIELTEDAMSDGADFILSRFIGSNVEVWAHGLLVGGRYGEITEIEDGVLWLSLYPDASDDRPAVGIPIEDIEKVVYL